MDEIKLALPLPDYRGLHQPGITDPAWATEPPPGVEGEIYGRLYAGQLERQRHLHIVTADVRVHSREELGRLLTRLSDVARHQMERPPPAGRPYDSMAATSRVTVTIGFGATLFTTVAGDDRFGLAAQRPASLKIMPQMHGDDEGFHPRDHASDLIVLIASDDYYVNEYIFGLLHYGNVHPGIRVRSAERGYARPDSREPSGFEDGISNPKGSELHRLVYVRDGDGEPDWCTGGTYLAYRKIRRRLRNFFGLKEEGQQEAVFGVDKQTGERFPPSVLKTIRDAHAAKMNPRRPNHTDLFGIGDLERQILRRPYFFDDGLDEDGEDLRGIHHLSFARNLGVQYEWPVLMWQTNPDFPKKGAGFDALYGAGAAANIGGGYYFMPRVAKAGEHIGGGLRL
ncbi:Dyp-type peroxidase [Ensifer sp. IC4062]|nr:Dyp-type peroxidase [Ensifer sp. IC4062]MCA1441980.1 Dyp-type peroxidase [Ensifer sp. IC4062]